MKTPPTYWKVKASPIVREFMQAQKSWNFPIERFVFFAKDNSFNNYGFNAGLAEYVFSNLPTITQAQFKKHFYDPWKAGQTQKAFNQMMGDPLQAMNDFMFNGAVAAKPKPTRQRVEMKYHLEVKQALQEEVESLQQDLTTAQSRLESLKQYNDQLAKINQSLADKLTTAETTIEKLHRSHLNELNELTKERDLAVYIAWGMGICAAVLAVAKLIGG